MSLEANIAELTKAVNALVEVLRSHTPDYAADAAEPPKRGPGRPRKTAAEPTTPSPAPTPTDMGAVNEGDAEGTTYWLNEKHNSVYRITPGDGTPGPMAGSVQITGADFLARQAEFAARFASAGNAPAPSPAPVPAADPSPAATAPTATAAPATAAPSSKVYDFAAARMALLDLAKKANGRELVLGILKKHGANSVPELANKASEVLVAVITEAEALAA